MKQHKKKKKLKKPQGIISCGYMFNGYKTKAYFWEFVKIYLRVLMLLAYELITKEVR